MAVALKTPLVLGTADDLVRVARDDPGYSFEREEDGTVIVRPSHTKGGAKSPEPLDPRPFTNARLATLPKEIGIGALTNYCL